LLGIGSVIHDPYYNTYFCGGAGGGGDGIIGTGGLGGGGRSGNSGGNNNGIPGTENTGGGGGPCVSNTVTMTPGAGGSGIIILSVTNT
jgi:hypothetical protein